MNKAWVGLAALALGAAAAVAYYRGGAAGNTGAAAGNAAPAASAASGAGGPPVSVTSVRAEQRDQVLTLQATGAVTALSSVDIHPQVSSVVARVHVREGQFVKAGELLFTLDSRADEVNVAKAQAQLQKDQAALADAQRQLARSHDLLRQQFVSQSAVDTAQTLAETQQAAVAASRAALDAAKVSLSYNRIAAPGGGRVGAINVYPGSYVQPAGLALLTITQLDPIAVAFSLPQRNLADALAGLHGGSGTGGGPVRAQLPDGGGTLTGRLQFVDSTVDAASGNVRVKALFDNPKQQLWPGAYVNVSMAVRTIKDAIVVPQAAVVQSPRGTLVYVIEDRRAAPRRVTVVAGLGENAVVSGVAPGDQVIVEGRQNVRPGSLVVERAAGAAASPVAP